MKEILPLIGLALKLLQELLDKVNEVHDANEQAKIQEAMQAHDLDALRRLLFKP